MKATKVNFTYLSRCYFTLHKDYLDGCCIFSNIHYDTILQDPMLNGASFAFTSQVYKAAIMCVTESTNLGWLLIT
jgi:hypothetical protein